MTKQEDKRYCTICGKRIGAHIQNIQTFKDGTASYEIMYYSASFTEPACLCRGTALTVYASTPVPQAFYDAFSDEEVQL